LKRVRTILAAALVGAAAAAHGCAAQPERIFYDDSDAAGPDATSSDAQADATAGDAGSERDSANTDADAAATDVTADSTGDASNDGAVDGPPDAPGEASPDAPSEAEAGCGSTNTISNCGACGIACDTLHSTGASCNGVSCSYSGCVAGWGDCVTTGPPNTDGCETPLDTLSNCTGCGLTCDSVHSLGRSCDGGTCGYTGCAPGYGDCITTGPPNTDGCETALNTVSNCTGCGKACDTAHSLGAQCTASGCTYSGCAAGWSNCNSAAPDTAGCACNTPGCCGTSCQVTHNNGVGNLTYDCLAQGTYDQTHAMAACTAYTGNASQCVQIVCATNTPNYPNGPLICSSGAPTKNCVCWSYGGNDIGYFDNGGAPPGPMLQNCFCPDPTFDTKWN
jgi:hypothetical protein